MGVLLQGTFAPRAMDRGEGRSAARGVAGVIPFPKL